MRLARDARQPARWSQRAGCHLPHVVLVMLRMVGVQGMVGSVGVLDFAALVMVAMMVMPVLTMRMLVAVVSFAVMDIVGGIGVHRRDGASRLRWATSGHRRSPFLSTRCEGSERSGANRRRSALPFEPDLPCSQLA